MICSVTAANYYPKSGTRSAVLDLVRIIDGHRTPIISFRVSSKREARQLAKTYGAQPWNF